MLQSTSSPSVDFIAPFNLSSQETAATPRYFAHNSARCGPALIPSIAKTAGLSRFVYLIGHSKHRYVFSGIAKGQMSLYNNAVFAVAENHKDDNLWVGTFCELAQLLNSRPAHGNYRFFVHLLAEGDEAKSDVISDLCHSGRDWGKSSLNREAAVFAI